MGIPAYFRWISEKYPRIMVDCVEHVRRDPSSGAETLPDATTPNPNGLEFDNLYLDMNGIIHPCTHPEDGPAPRTEPDMFAAVCDYIDRIFAIVRPRRLVYMAVDGVAPRAKINQQRSRRFRSAREVEDKRAVARELREEWDKMGLRIASEKRSGKRGAGVSDGGGGGDDDDANNDANDGGVNNDDDDDDDDDDNDDDDDDDDGVFDSNVITPGTPFMSRLAVALRAYVTLRLRDAPAWRHVVVVFSDASVPGEGEHKIAEYIRRERTQDGYHPNLRHVMYGLDADLIMLALATHEVNFTILREEVFPKRGGQRHGGGNGGGAQQSGSGGGGGGGGGGGRAPVQIDTVMAERMKEEGLSTRAELGGKKPFHFLHVNILREYLDYEFRDDIEKELGVAEAAPRTRADGTVEEDLAYDLERVLDDFVFMCFFVGNDFLPHLPTLDIREGAIDYLIELYKTELPRTGYLTSAQGDVDFARVRKLLLCVGQKEDEVFRERSNREQQSAARAAREKKDKLERKAQQERKDQQQQQVAASSPKAPSSKRTAAEKDRGYQQAAFSMGTVELGRKEKKPKIGSGEANAAAALALKATLKRKEKKKKGTEETSKVTRAHRGEDVGIKAAADSLERKTPLPVVIKTKPEFKEALEERMRAKNELEVFDNIKLGEEGWKERYYRQKFGWGPENVKEKQVLLRKYIEGLQWVMKYYYVGCMSWGWYYPYHYAPFASDLVECDIGSEDIQLEIGEPFAPFSQLQAVMPASSGKLVLPKCYSDLMVNPDSPIIDYYPENFELDLNGKRFAWQGVALLPFIDEKRLNAALLPLQDQLTEEEKERNSFGECCVMVHKDSALGQARSKRESADPMDRKKIPAEAASEQLFGKASYPLSRYGGNCGAVYTVSFTLPSYKPHSSQLLATATPAPPALNDAHRADSRRSGWKQARFGSLGRAAKDLIADRNRRLGHSGPQRGRGRPKPRENRRGGGGGHSSFNPNAPVINPPSVGQAAAASTMFGGLGAGAPGWMNAAGGSRGGHAPTRGYAPPPQQHAYEGYGYYDQGHGVGGAQGGVGQAAYGVYTDAYRQPSKYGGYYGAGQASYGPGGAGMGGYGAPPPAPVPHGGWQAHGGREADWGGRHAGHENGWGGGYYYGGAEQNGRGGRGRGGGRGGGLAGPTAGNLRHGREERRGGYGRGRGYDGGWNGSQY